MAVVGTEIKTSLSRHEEFFWLTLPRRYMYGNQHDCHVRHRNMNWLIALLLESLLHRLHDLCVLYFMYATLPCRVHPNVAELYVAWWLCHLAMWTLRSYSIFGIFRKLKCVKTFFVQQRSFQVKFKQLLYALYWLIKCRLHTICVHIRQPIHVPRTTCAGANYQETDNVLLSNQNNFKTMQSLGNALIQEEECQTALNKIIISSKELCLHHHAKNKSHGRRPSESEPAKPEPIRKDKCSDYKSQLETAECAS